MPDRSVASFNRSFSIRLSIAFCLVMALFLPSLSQASENSCSVYPIGAETVLPGMIPGAHQTTLIEFSTVYEANQLDNSAGASATSEFKVRVSANAIKLVHNWNVPFLGGALNSNIAVPMAYEQLHIASGDASKYGLGNVIIGVFQVGYQRNTLHWFYEGDLYFPGAPYVHSDMINIGQNNYAVAPVGGFTYLPRQGQWEVSSKFEYIVNFHDAATNYRSGNEFTWEYNTMRQVSRRAAVGVNGYLYQQTTNDLSNGVIFNEGNRGRDLAIGPELRVPLGGHSVLAVKYFRDTLVENKPRGNAFWFEMAMPLTFGKRPQEARTVVSPAVPRPTGQLSNTSSVKYAEAAWQAKP